MRRVFVISLAGIALSGCASMSLPGLSFLTPAPPMVTLQLESVPVGAEARTSAGPSCRTPCSVSVPAQPLSVTYTLDRFQPQTVSVQPTEQTAVQPNIDAGGSAYIVEMEPNPVFAQLEPMAPPKRTTKRPPPKRVAKRPPAPAAPAAASPFPAPQSSTPFPTR
jgi:hypothetical protein